MQDEFQDLILLFNNMRDIFQNFDYINIKVDLEGGDKVKLFK